MGAYSLLRAFVRILEKALTRTLVPKGWERSVIPSIAEVSGEVENQLSMGTFL